MRFINKLIVTKRHNKKTWSSTVAVPRLEALALPEV